MIHQLWAGVVVVVAILVAVVVLSLLKADTAVFVSIVATVGAPAIAILLSIHGKTEAVRQQTNGNTSALVDLVRRQSDIIASLPASGQTDEAGTS